MSADYNPNDINAVLSRIEANQATHSGLLLDIRKEASKTNGRVTALERDKWFSRGVTATIGLIAPGAWEYFKSKS